MVAAADVEVGAEVVGGALDDDFEEDPEVDETALEELFLVVLVERVLETDVFDPLELEEPEVCELPLVELPDFVLDPLADVFVLEPELLEPEELAEQDPSRFWLFEQLPPHLSCIATSPSAQVWYPGAALP